MTSARELANTYAAFFTAQLIGEEIETIDFGLWLDEYWEDASGRRIEACRDDLDIEATPHHRIEWLEEGEEIIGLLAGRYRGCFRIPLTATPPHVALMLDDAPACSTGSIHQERAHVADTVSRGDRLLAVAHRDPAERDNLPASDVIEPFNRALIAYRLGLAESIATAG
jgi:hypothetical protein